MEGHKIAQAQILTPAEMMGQEIARHLIPIKEKFMAATISLVIRFPDNQEVPGGVLFISEETDTEPLHDAINRAVLARNASRVYKPA